MRIVVNGKPMQVADGLTLGALLDERGIDPRSVLVELNSAPLPRERIREARLCEGDSIEVVRMVGGG
jgi:sulfur carrier protein